MKLNPEMFCHLYLIFFSVRPAWPTNISPLTTCFTCHSQKYRRITEIESPSFARSMGKKILWFHTPELAELQVLIHPWFWTRVWTICAPTALHCTFGSSLGTDRYWSCPVIELWCPWDLPQHCEHPCMFPSPEAIWYRRFRFCGS